MGNKSVQEPFGLLTASLDVSLFKSAFESGPLVVSDIFKFIWWLDFLKEITWASEINGRPGYSRLEPAFLEEIDRYFELAQENSQLYKATEHSIHKYQELNELKDLFLAMVSHELRTPITAIRGYAQLLQRRINPEQSGSIEQLYSYADNIIYQTSRLNKMIDQLLDFSRINTGQFEIQPEPGQNLNRLLERIVTQHSGAEQNHSILLDLPVQSVTVPLDKSRFEQVMDNLITNAFKYSESGTTVKIGLEVLQTEVVIRVQDEGQGISQEEQAHIFDRFYRIKNKNNHKIKGLGLGLYISYEIAYKHGGRLWVESEPGTGSTFFVTLPFQIPNR